MPSETLRDRRRRRAGDDLAQMQPGEVNAIPGGARGNVEGRTRPEIIAEHRQHDAVLRAECDPVRGRSDIGFAFQQGPEALGRQQRFGRGADTYFGFCGLRMFQ